MEDLRQTLSPIFNEMLDQREIQIVSQFQISTFNIESEAHIDFYDF